MIHNRLHSTQMPPIAKSYPPPNISVRLAECYESIPSQHEKRVGLGAYGWRYIPSLPGLTAEGQQLTQVVPSSRIPRLRLKSE